MAPDLKKKGSPTSKKAAQVARVGTGRDVVYQGHKHQPVTPGTRTTHGVRSEMPKETCCPRASGRHAGAARWVAELSRERVPWGEQPPGGQNHTEKSAPRRSGQKPGPKARVGKDLASSTSAVLPVGQRNQMHRASGSSGSLIIIKESANPSKGGLRNKGD